MGCVGADVRLIGFSGEGEGLWGREDVAFEEELEVCCVGFVGAGYGWGEEFGSLGG